MSQSYLSSYQFSLAENHLVPNLDRARDGMGPSMSADLARQITKESSTQTYFTILFLVDRLKTENAYRAYAYFRWVDDSLDQGELTQPERLSLLARQQEIVELCYQGEPPVILYPEEQLIVDLIASDNSRTSGLYIYIQRMMAVMAFDVGRKDRLISSEELNSYTLDLATAVTEALHYFIGQNDAAPQDERRYAAVAGAHITHMLRDALEDTAVGYYNIPLDFLEAEQITPNDVNSEPYRAWVVSQVQQARACFETGRAYLAQVQNVRRRLAGYAYIARFEVVLDAIERDNYYLRAAYPERKGKKAFLTIALAAMKQTLTTSMPQRQEKQLHTTTSLEVIR